MLNPHIYHTNRVDDMIYEPLSPILRGGNSSAGLNQHRDLELNKAAMQELDRDMNSRTCAEMLTRVKAKFHT